MPVLNDVIVSMASYPARIEASVIAIESVFAQEYRPSRVLLWLPREEFGANALPEGLRRLEARGLEIRYVDDNYKSHNKLLHAVKAFPGHHIVTIDDDVIYPRWWLCGLYRKHLEHPHSVICYRGHFLNLEGHSVRLLPEDIKDRSLPGIHRLPGDIFMPTGVSGVLYPAGCFDHRFFDAALFSRTCMNADDVWYKAMAMLAGTKTVRVLDYNLHFTIIMGTQRGGLWIQDKKTGTTDKALSAIFSELPELYGKIRLLDVQGE